MLRNCATHCSQASKRPAAHLPAAVHRVQRRLGQAAKPECRVAAGAADGRVQGGRGGPTPAVQAKRRGLSTAKRSKQSAPRCCAARGERLGLEGRLPHRLLRWLLWLLLPLLLLRRAAAATIRQHGLLLLCQAGGQPIQVSLVLHHQQLHCGSGQPIPRLQLLRQRRGKQGSGGAGQRSTQPREPANAAPAATATCAGGRAGAVKSLGPLCIPFSGAGALPA